MKKISFLLLLLMVIAVPAFAQSAEKKNNMEEAEGFYLPKGNPDAGREAFVQLKCIACHRVEGDTDLPKPIASKQGPVLGVAKEYFSMGEIADAIVSPSHKIVGNEGAQDMSRMPEFADTMTVRQLVNLVAYLNGMQTGEYKPKKSA